MKEPLIKKEYLTFSVWFIAIFFFTFSALYVFGLVPNIFQSEDSSTIVDTIVNQANAQSPFIMNAASQAVDQKGAYQGEAPTHITIPKIGVNASVSNPTTTDVDALDNYLTKGAVHYPGSGLLADGNLFIFGHSTNWSVVQNQAYKTFDDLNKLSAGDSIEVTGSTKVFVYTVQSVTLADDDQIWVDLSSSKPTLTLSTCNTFGKKQQRYVVSANYAYSYPMGEKDPGSRQ